MSTSRGIFDNFANQPSSAEAPSEPKASPFAIAESQPQSQSAGSQAPNGSPSPFAVESPAAPTQSPFGIAPESAAHDDQKAVRIPERRKQEPSPFQISEPQGFGFEAPSAGAPALKAVAIEQPQQQAAPRQAASASPFQVNTPAQAPATATPSPFGGWPQADATPPRQEETRPAPQQAPAPAAAPIAPAPAPQQAAPQRQPDPSSSSEDSDSYSIKQLELRAIFGVDREMTHEEILQRARSLPGIRQIARVAGSDIATVDALKTLIANLGFGNNPIKLYSGSVPIDFIRENNTLLAVQTDGGFAPGVRETLMIVARELGR